MSEGARIYNLFPLLAGPIETWKEHLPRIAQMKFNWVYVNPFHQTGASGSLYAIKDFGRLDPRIQGNSKKSQDELVKAFCDEAARHGLRVMFDLVINHTAKDALLVQERPAWYRREADGSVREPRTVEHNNNVVVWRDLGELEYGNGGTRQEMVAYWARLVERYLKMGCSGFRCDAAYQVPKDVWTSIIEQARRIKSDCLFTAETLGCSPEQTLMLNGAGFDYLFNSSKWWDFRSEWLFDQYNKFRHVAPSIGFPESHDTERLINELGVAKPSDAIGQYRFRYLFSAVFSAAVMISMGYEYGFNRRLHVVKTTAEDWKQQVGNKPFDLTAFITQVNTMKAKYRALNLDGEQRWVRADGGPAIGLLRFDAPAAHNAREVVASVLNPDVWQDHGMDAGRLIDGEGSRFGAYQEITPGLENKSAAGDVFQPGRWIGTQPTSLRIFKSPANT